MTGVELIAIERQRQIKEGYTAEHDDAEREGALAFAACCFAAPERLYRKTEHISANGVTSIRFTEPWPWDENKLLMVGKKDRLHQLATAGALIAAEMDKILRQGLHSKPHGNRK